MRQGFDSQRFRPLVSLSLHCIERPRVAFAVALLLLACAVPGLFRLRLRTDGHALVPRQDPAIALDASIRDHFGLRDPIIVLVTSDDPRGIYNAATLNHVRELSAALSQVEGVGRRNVMSLATERRDRVRPGTLQFRAYLDDEPLSAFEIETLRDDIEAAGLLTGTLVSADARSTSILVGMPIDAGTALRSSIHREIQDIVERTERPHDAVVVVGAPVAEALLGLHILEDLALLLPLALGVIALVVWIGCGRLWGVALAVLEVCGCLVLTFGIMGWLGIPVYLTTAVLPVILATVGIADEIHVFWQYQRVLAERGSASGTAAVAQTMAQMVRPISLTTLTTVIGLLSFPFSPLVPVRMFGAFAALGTALCLLWTLTITPAALASIPAAGMTRPPRSWLFPRWHLERLVCSPLAVTAALILISLLAVLGLPRLRIQDSWVGGFARHSSFRAAIDHVNRQLHGMHLLLVHVSFAGYHGEPPPLDRPDVLRAIGGLEAFVRARPEVGGVLGPYSHLTAVGYLWKGRQEVGRVLPAEPREIEELWRMFERGRGVDRRREIVDDAKRRAVVTVFLENANYRDTARLTGEIRAYAAREWGSLGATIDFAGDVAVSQATIPAIVETQLQSLGLALAGAFLSVAWVTRSWRLGLVTILPAGVSVLWVLGAMGWAGISMGVASSMFCAITLGIGVDYSIHLLEGLRRAGRAGSRTPTRTALAEVGPAIVLDTLAVSLGFGLLALSRVPANVLLGLLASCALVSGCLLTLAGLGSLAAAAERFAPARALLFGERT